MPRNQFSVDISGILKGMDYVDEDIHNKAEVGVGRAMVQLQNDAINQQPTAPIKEGFLRGSVSIFVNNKRINTEIEGKTEFRNDVLSQHIEEGQIVGFIGFNVPYAARAHEVPMNFTEPSAGNKFLESKMSKNKMLYKKIIHNAVVE